MKRIDEDIKANTYKQVYLFYGEEDYLKQQYKNKLLSAIMPTNREMNYTKFEGKETNPAQLIDLAETLPFFEERRILLVENSGFFKGSAEQLADYLKQPAETAVFLFLEQEVDRRCKMYKAAEKYARAIEFATPGEEVLLRWILNRAKGEKKQFSRENMQKFLMKTGTDMVRIDRELEKLFCYTMDADVIESGDIDAITSEEVSNKVFEMIDLISGHDQKGALDRYYDLLALKEPPMRILYLLTRQFRILFIVKQMSQKGFAKKDIATKAGCPPWAVPKSLAQSKGFSMGQLKQALLDGTQLEEEVKTGRLDDQVAVELMIVRYAKQA